MVLELYSRTVLTLCNPSNFVYFHVDCSRRMKTCFECKTQVAVPCPSDSGSVQYMVYIHICALCYFLLCTYIEELRNSNCDNSYLDSSDQALTPHTTKRKGVRFPRAQGEYY